MKWGMKQDREEEEEKNRRTNHCGCFHIGFIVNQQLDNFFAIFRYSNDE
jgi:hypothetical protein